MKLGLTQNPFCFYDDAVSIFLLTISGTRNERNQSTNRFSTASPRIPIRALDHDLVRPHQALLLLGRFQQTHGSISKSVAGDVSVFSNKHSVRLLRRTNPFLEKLFNCFS
ncbi:hypothetical protein HID58_095800 [Brassica napus]|uniref:Uncharacterized protein n=1 Tax=Brassica napus TaxID=3708 RepID=A0ABQ7X4S3_BRANA|nr:hypothetical protein HID58_095800 [Brassica napus]